MQTGTIEGSTASVVGIMRRTMMSEGLPGLFRGVSAPLTAVSPIYAVSFWGYDIGQRLVKSFNSDNNGRPLNLLEISIAGGFSALPTTGTTCVCQHYRGCGSIA
eukprot:scaffold25626_cov137-Cylindrotheca_fusiformis.AAC.11